MNKKARTRKFTTKQSARLGAYFAAGVGASMAVSSDAEAVVVYFPVNPTQSIAEGEGLSFGSINLSNGTYVLGDTTSPFFTLSGVGTSLFSFLSSYGPSPFMEVALTTTGYYADAANFSLNDSISGTADFLSNSLIGSYGGNWVPGTSGFLGLRIDQGGGDFNYGWAQFALGPNSGDPATISGFAFETDLNTAILAGDQGGGPGPEPIPEPGTWAAAALLLGGATYLGWRRRRDAAQKEAA